MRELAVAVIGCGSMGRTHLARWSDVSGVRIAAVCDTDRAAAMRAATDFGAEAHTNWKSLLDDPEIDLVDVCTPPDLHRVIALASFARSKNVLCEKPLARSSTEAREMADAADAAGRTLMTAFCHRFDPLVLFAKELIDNDDLGRIVMFRSRFSGNFPDIDAAWFADRERSGGGALLDTGVHSIDLFRYLVGEVASATGRLATANPRVRVDDCAAAVLQAENDALGIVETSWATPGGRNVLELYGSAGACIVDFDSNQVRYLTADMPVWETREITGPDKFQREILHFADVVRGLQPLMATARDGVRAIEVVEQIERNGSVI